MTDTAVISADTTRRAEKHDSEMILWITPDRIFYAGLLGTPSMRTMGSLMIYVATKGKIRIAVGSGDWQVCEMAVVHPYEPHQLLSEAPLINLIKIEAETIDLDALPPLLATSGAVNAPSFVELVQKRHQELCGQSNAAYLATLDFDQLFFGQALPKRQLDQRIKEVVDMIKRDPAAVFHAECCAESVHLSFSRFLHLFKQEVGASFRSFRSWKRARSVLQHVTDSGNLVYIALDVGYPDSTHFSRCVKRAYGLQPRQIFAGSRRLIVHSMD